MLECFPKKLNNATTVRLFTFRSSSSESTVVAISKLMNINIFRSHAREDKRTDDTSVNVEEERTIHIKYKR